MNNMSITIQQNVIPLKCQRCRHKWNYTGKNKYVATCPHCRTYVTLKKGSILLIGKHRKPKQSGESISVTSKVSAYNHE